MSELKNIVGQKFGMMTVISRDESAKDRVKWICQCDCGNQKSVLSYSLISGHTVSCGCKKFESHNKKHGMKHTRLYSIWCDIRKRCYNQNCKSYRIYGGKGISICDEWKTDFTAFQKWSLCNGYTDDLTIDRIDSSKDYSPDNCRWADRKTQNNNRSVNIIIKIGDSYETLSQTCEKYNFSYSKAWDRIKKLRKENHKDEFEFDEIFY